MLLPIAHAAEESAGGLTALGLDWGSLAFQLINFGLLLVILRAFAYKPVLKILETRRQRVEESLRSADEIARAKAELDLKVKQAIEETRRKGQALMAASQARAETLIKEAEGRARVAADQIEQQAKARLAEQVATVRAELKQEIVQLVAVAAGQILAERLDTKRDEELIAEAVAAAEQHLSTQQR